VNRIGLGRHGLIEENAGDPLDGLVNLFDIGMVLAVAFLIAGLGLALDLKSEGAQPRDPARRSARILPSPAGGPSASGRGEPVGQVYRLPDGRLIYVKGAAGASAQAGSR
jgi:hypothetical protein